MKQMFSRIFQDAAVERCSTRKGFLEKHQDVLQNLMASHFNKKLAPSQNFQGFRP